MVYIDKKRNKYRINLRKSNVNKTVIPPKIIVSADDKFDLFNTIKKQVECRMPSVVYRSSPKNLLNDVYADGIFLDFRHFKSFEKLREIKRNNPDSNIVLFNYDEGNPYEILNQGIADIVLPGSSVAGAVNRLRDEGRFSQRLSVTVLGFGRAGYPITADLAGRIREGANLRLGLFSKSLSKGVYRGLSEGQMYDELIEGTSGDFKKLGTELVGYDEARALISTGTEDLKTYDSLEESLEDADIVVYASSNRSLLPKVNHRSEHDKLLFEGSYPYFSEVLDTLDFLGNTPLIVNCSNPPESLNYYAYLRGYPKEKLVTSSSDVERGKDAIKRLFKSQTPHDLELTVLGPHSNPFIDLRLSNWDFKEEKYIQKLVNNEISKKLANYGPEARRSGKPDSLLGWCVGKDIERISKMISPKYLGYFFQDFGGWMFGPIPSLNNHKIEIHEPQFKKIEKEVLEEMKPNFWRLINVKNELANEVYDGES